MEMTFLMSLFREFLDLLGMKLKGLLALTGILVAILIGLVWYVATHRMMVVPERMLGQDGAPAKVLIATQGSPYKDAVTRSIARDLTGRGVQVHLRDVTTLAEVDPDAWDAIVVMHTWEFWMPQRDAREFRLEHGRSENIIYLSTSSSGEERIEVDAVSSASMLTDTVEVAQALLQRLSPLIPASTDVP